MPAVSVRVSEDRQLSVIANAPGQRRSLAAGLLQQSFSLCCGSARLSGGFAVKQKQRQRAENGPRPGKLLAATAEQLGRSGNAGNRRCRAEIQKQKKSTAEVLPSRAAPRCDTSPRPPGVTARKHMNINEAGDGKGETVLSELFLDKCLKQGSN